MSELQLDCKGSILLFNPEDAYCKQCPLKAECEIEVNRNRASIEEAVGKDVFTPASWRETATVTRKRKAMAKVQSADPEAKPEPTPKPKPAPQPKTLTPPAITAPLNKMTPFEALSSSDLKVKVRDQLEVWVQKGVDPSVIEQGQSPFALIPTLSFCITFVEALLALGKPTKRELKAEIERIQIATKGKAWSDASLQSNINIVAGAFKACGYDLLKEK